MIWISSTENDFWNENKKVTENPADKGSELIIGERA